MLTWIGLGAVALVASTLAAVTGFGGAALLLPVLVAIFGIREAIPILTVAQLAGNGARAWFNHRELDGRVVAWFALGGVPMGIAGGLLFARAPIGLLVRLLGAFLILVVVWRRARPQRTRAFPVAMFAVIGAGASLLSALVGSVGPLMAPFYLAFGLVKGAYIGTEALSAVVMHVAKLAAYQRADVLSGSGLLVGAALGPVMVLGSYLGKRIVDRLPERLFVAIIEIVLVAAGAVFLWRG